MKSRALSILPLFLISILLCSSLSSQEKNPLEVRKLVLDNGLTVYLNEDHTQPSVFGCVVAKAGSKYEDKDATGVAHYLEHMLFKGTDVIGALDRKKEKPIMEETYKLYDELVRTKDENAKKAIFARINDVSVEDSRYAIPNEFDSLIQEMGGARLNAYTNEDYAAYISTCPPQEIAKWIDINSQRFINPVFRFFQSELETVYEEKNRSTDNYIDVIFSIVASRCYTNHPYGREVLGTTEHIKNPSLAKMAEFFKTYYVANNMALVLCGDFDSAKIIPLIKSKFGRLPKGRLPDVPEYKEAPFQGREFYAKPVSPAPVGVIAWRAVPTAHPDAYALAVCNYLLANENKTGMLNQSINMNRLRNADALQVLLADYGLAAIYYVPNMSGSLADGEKQVLEAVDRLRRGDFSDDAFQAAKTNLRKRFEVKIESLENRNYQMTESFACGRSLEETLRFSEKLERLTRADVVKVAGAYFTGNYFCYYSNVGTLDKETLVKPDLKPISTPLNAKSAYAVSFEKIPSDTYKPHFVDFQNDVKTVELKPNARLFWSKNPMNDFFSLQIRYQVGSHTLRKIPFALYYLGDLGTAGLSSLDLKREMEKLGCNYSMMSGWNETVVSVDGYEANVGKALRLLSGFFTGVKPEPARLDAKVKYEISYRQGGEKRDLLNVAGALNDYLQYGDQAWRLNRLSIDELKKTGSDDYLVEFAKIFGYEVKLYYSGKKDPGELKNIILDNYRFGESREPAAPYYVQEPATYKENTVLFLDRKDARQSQVYFYVKGKTYAKGNVALINAFRNYIGGSMNSILFQEIREFRSMAYATRAAVSTPEVWDHNYFFTVYIGCQDDKTIDAMRTMTNIMKNMPVNKDKFATARENLVKLAFNSRPEFRKLPAYVAGSQSLGFDQDPLVERLPQYQAFDFSEVLAFYRNNFQGGPIAIGIVGNKAKIDMTKLKEFGTVIEVDQAVLFRD